MPAIPARFPCPRPRALTRWLAPAVGIWLLLPAAHAEPAGDLFLNAYVLREDGLKAEKSGDFKIAYDRYRAAARLYDQVARDYPDWKPSMVAYRRKGMAEQIAAVAEQAAKMEIGRPANDPRPLPPGSRLADTLSSSGQSASTPGLQARPITSQSGTGIRPPTTASSGTDDPYARRRIEELERRQAGAQRLLEDLGKERDALKARLTEVENNRMLADYEAKRYRTERDGLRSQLTELQEKGINTTVSEKARITSLQKSLAEAEKSLAATEEKLKKANAETKDAAERAAAVATQSAARQIADLEKALAESRETAKRAAETASRSLAELEQTVATSKDEAGKANDAKAAAEQSARAANEALASANQKVAALETALAESASKARTAAAKAAAEAAEKAAREAAARAANDAARQTAEMEKSLAELKAQLAGSGEKHDQTSRKIAELEKALAASEAKAKETAAVAAPAMPPAEIAAMQARLAEVEALLAAARQEKEKFLADLRIVTDERDRLRAERDQLATRLASQESTPTVDPTLVQTNQRLEAELAEARKMLAEMTAARDTDTTRIKELRDKLVQVESELAAVRKENATFRDQMAALETRLAEVQKSLDEATTTASDNTLAEENRTLKSIVIRQLQQQAFRARARKLLLSELAKLEINSKALLGYIDQLEGKETIPTPGEVTRIDDNYIRALSGVELSGQFFTQDGGQPAAGQPGSQPGDQPAAGQPGSPLPANAMPPGLAANPDARDAFDFQKRSLATSAETSFQKGDFGRAEETYRLIVDADPSDVRMQCNLGVSLLKQEKFSEAANRFQEALKHDEANAFGHLMLAICHWKLSQPELAVDRLNRSLVIQPGNPQAWLYLGLVAIDRKSWQDAETAFKKALDARPDYALAHYNLALVYTKPGFADPVQARDHYRLSLKHGGQRDESLELFLRPGGSPAVEGPDGLPALASPGSPDDQPPVIDPDIPEEELPQL